jgi:hypothetical protein
MPVGVVLGIAGGLGTKQRQSRFCRGRAVVAGGLAGTIGGLAFGVYDWRASGRVAQKAPASLVLRCLRAARPRCTGEKTSAVARSGAFMENGDEGFIIWKYVYGKIFSTSEPGYEKNDEHKCCDWERNK